MSDLPLPPLTRYDQAARYLLAQTGGEFFKWVLKRTGRQLTFVRWLSPQLTLPGVQQRLCDGVAALLNQDDGGRPFAALVEIQTAPDVTMPGRLMIAGGIVWITLKPANLPGDRFELIGIVLNLTGIGNSSRRSILAGTEWKLKPREVNFETLDAGKVLREIAEGAAPWQLLALIPLMKRGDKPAIIRRWRELVLARGSPQQRGDCGLALVFAERAGRAEIWRNVMSEITFIESPMIGELLATAEARAKIEEKAEMLLRVLHRLQATLPDSVVTTLRACTDPNALDRWIDLALEATTLEQFRQNAGV